MRLDHARSCACVHLDRRHTALSIFSDFFLLVRYWSKSLGCLFSQTLDGEGLEAIEVLLGVATVWGERVSI